MRKKVAIVGGGYGGAKLAKTLDPDLDVVLIDPKDAFVHSAAALRALVRPDWAENIFFPYGTLMKNGTVVRDRAVGVDARGVTLASGDRVDADYVVLASGSSYAFPAKMHTDVTEDALDALRAAHQELAGSHRVLILGAGPVGLELAGEIATTWPDKRVTIVDPAAELLPGFLPGLVADLRGQLDKLGIELRLGAGLTADPAPAPGIAGEFTVTDQAGDQLTADIWFRAYGSRIHTDFLDGAVPRNERGQVKVTERLTVEGHDTVYALGDITDVPETKMAGWALRHAEVVAANILAHANGEEPAAAHTPLPIKVGLVPLGPAGGVGQFPNDEGAAFQVPKETVIQMKGAEMMLGHFQELFNI
ncbi:FAD-dependent oxidoreductase [Catenulispora sp. NF23]|uniref:NAD(P)/FAD-dependent oxidoreductase n=1 Tax=Catenulispora pinistramenti TaxID=2705254 RepID=UPI001BA9C1D3|nr:FAD-dependent oxidoreductase [Catenulispora pinistramenti]MBS2536356.1 FAD-dependent oxidoreductase [Catenulispora pinistramenti]